MNFWEISSFETRSSFSRKRFPMLWRRTICVCDRLKTYAQARTVKVNEATIFMAMGSDFTGETRFPGYLNWILYTPMRLMLFWFTLDKKTLINKGRHEIIFKWHQR